MKRVVTRWIEGEAPDELAALLASADADAPEAALDRVRARLQSTLGRAFDECAPSSTSNPAPRAAGIRAAVLLGRKVWLGPAALVALSMGWPWLSELGTGSTERPEAAARPGREVAPVAITTTTATPGEVPRPAPVGATLSPPGVERGLNLTPNPEDRLSRRPGNQPIAHRPPIQAHAGLGLAAELQQLRRIKALLPRSPRRALAAARVHARRFPHGTLGQERELLYIEALVRLGRVDAARKLGEQVLERPGSHAYRAQIRALLTGP